MTTPEEEAIVFKNEGNKAFAAHDWPRAIELYSKAIDLNEKEPIFWSNRAQVGPATPKHPSAVASARVTDPCFHFTGLLEDRSVRICRKGRN